MSFAPCYIRLMEAKCYSIALGLLGAPRVR